MKNMNTPSLSIVLVTLGNQPLLKYAIESLIIQIGAEDEFVISINSGDPEAEAYVRQIVSSVHGTSTIRIISTLKKIEVYEHYKFAISAASKDFVVIAHDDELYGSKTLGEIKKGFAHNGVNVVVGGMVKVDISNLNCVSEKVVCFDSEEVFNGLEWVLSKETLYPPFCYSALAVKKPTLALEIFSSNGTAVDCLVVARQAIEGKVFQSKEIFATWLQLPTRNSRWWVLKPDLIAPWKEFLDYYEKIGNTILIRRAMDAKVAFFRSFLKMLFIVGIANQNGEQIRGCLKKIGEIHPLMEKMLFFAKWPVLYNLAGPFLMLFKKLSKKYLFVKRCSNCSSTPPLEVTSEMWVAFIAAAKKMV